MVLPPLAELHCHIEGAASPGLVRRVAAKHGVDLTGLFDDGGRYRWHDFTSFLGAYDRASSVFRTEEDYRDLAYDYFSAPRRSSLRCRTPSAAPATSSSGPRPTCRKRRWSWR